MNDNIVTLTTDWGNSDNYTAIFKAHLYREYSDIKIVDVTHNVKKNTIIDAAFLVRTMYFHFPKNSIHIVDVNFLATHNERKYQQILKKEHSTESLNFTHYLAFTYDGHYFMCENNGIIPLLCDVNQINTIVKLPFDETYSNFHSFKAIPYWARAAASLARTNDLISIGESYNIEDIEMSKMPIAFAPRGQNDKIIFHSQHIDSYGNIITNLHKDLFDEVADGRKVFDFYCTQTGTQNKRRISIDYNDKHRYDDQLMFVFGHSQHLEICARYAPIAKILKAEFFNMEFTINFPPKIEE